MNKIFICKNCGKEFSPNYRIKNNRTLNFCSKSCASSYKHKGCIELKWFNKTLVENVLKKIILQENRYLTKEDICSIAKISSKTLSKFRISILSLNRECGMKKPKSVFEDKIKTYLFLKFSDCEEEKTFSNCLSPKGYNLRFDVYIPSKNVLIELDGTLHYDLNNPNYSEYLHLCDLIKNQWCKENDIILVRIPYTKKVTNAYIEKFINFN